MRNVIPEHFLFDAPKCGPHRRDLRHHAARVGAALREVLQPRLERRGFQFQNARHFAHVLGDGRQVQILAEIIRLGHRVAAGLRDRSEMHDLGLVGGKERADIGRRHARRRRAVQRRNRGLEDNRQSRGLRGLKACKQAAVALRLGGIGNDGAAGAALVESIVRDQKKLFTCCVALNGEYGQKDICLGVPVIIGKTGWEKIIDFGLNADEQALFNKSADAVRSMNDVLKTL